MRRWSPRALAAARNAAELHGVRVRCLACSWQGRWHPESRLLTSNALGGDAGTMQGFEAHPAQHERGSGGRLRDTRCPQCHELELRSIAWMKRYPTRADAEITRARRMADLFR